MEALRKTIRKEGEMIPEISPQKMGYGKTDV